MNLLSRFKKPPPTIDPNSINYTPEHISLAKAIVRRRRIIHWLNIHLPYLRLALVFTALIWLGLLPHDALWKNTYIDEHAIQPAQVTMYYDWSNVHAADRYLAQLEQVTDRSTYLQDAFSLAGLHTSNTSTATYAHVQPPRSAGTEVILISANWESKTGGPNLRGIAMLLSLGAFLRGQNHWAFDLVLVVGDGYMEGLEGFMQDYYDLFPGLIWTALNIDYPGHSFEHIGLYYEGVNGRLPNQDVVNTVAHVARWAGGVHTRLHDVEDKGNSYVLGVNNLWEHAKYMALGRASGAHGVLAKHRIDSLTLYCPDATGPHGFHTLGRTLESTLRSFNNLLERLHASYFFYLLPQPGKFIPVGHYLPAAVLLGASVTLGGFDCPTPLDGLLWLVLPTLIALFGWIIQSPLVSLVGVLLPRPTRTAQRSVISLVHLFYGALIPTLAMVNFPQAILLAMVVIGNLAPWRWVRLCMLAVHPFWVGGLKRDWEVVGNLTWVGVFIWVPLGVVSAMI